MRHGHCFICTAPRYRAANGFWDREHSPPDKVPRTHQSIITIHLTWYERRVLIILPERLSQCWKLEPQLDAIPDTEQLDTSARMPASVGGMIARAISASW